MTLPVIAHRYGRPWLSVLAALAVLLATCLAAPGGALALPKAHPMHKITGGMYKNPIGRLSFLWRRSVSPSLQNAWGRNVGIGFADVTDKTNIKTNLRNVWLADVEQMKQDDPALYRALRLDQRPGVKTIAIIIRANTPKRNHAEQNILRALAEMGLGTDSLFQLYSDRSPCRYRCRALVPGHVDVDYLVKNEGKAKEPDSDFSKESTELLRRELAEAFADFEKDPAKPDLDPEAEWHRAEVARRQGKAQTMSEDWRNAPFYEPGACGPTESLTAPLEGSCAVGRKTNEFARAIGRPNTATPGGIDFSTLRLRYLSDNGEGIGYAFDAAPGHVGADLRPGTGLSLAKQQSDAFFVWLETARSKQWVNLNPDEPDRIIDAALGRTRAGEVLLKADLAMKKSIGRLIHPDHRLGASFWRRLTGSCLSMRTWIVPAPASVYQKGDQLFIMRAPLAVKMETDYLKKQGSNADVCPKNPSAEARNEALFRSMILPRLTAEINTSPRYAELRRVYLARVAAEWYRQRSARDDTAYGGLIDKGDVRRWASHDSWRPTDTFEKYVHSVRHGEFRVVHRSTHGNVVTTHTYVFGGVDFARVPFRAMSAAAFGRAAPNLARTVRQATDHPVVDPRLGKVLMGAPAPTVQRTASITGLLVVSVPLLLSVLIALGFALWIVVRRRRRTRRLPA